jgi:drug/metabolite transporter (DMT)-like permease
MQAALLGLVSALALGTADFMSRFSTRASSAAVSYGAVLLVGSTAMTAYILLAGHALAWPVQGVVLAVLHGISVAMMSLLLYTGLARGPVSVVAPIVAAHPALVVLVAVAFGRRPDAAAWIAMAAILAGGILVAWLAAPAEDDERAAKGELNRTLLIALAACLAYVLLILFGQAAAKEIGELQTTWIGRMSGLGAIVLLMLVRRERPAVGVGWWPFLLLQGLLDTAGYVALAAGGNTTAPEATAVVASGFSVVTVLLGRLVLKERIGWRQWAAILMIAGGTAGLAASG